MDFIKENWDGVAVEIVNLEKATFMDSETLKEVLQDDLSEGFKKVVVDLSKCSYIDPIFLGGLIFTLKRLVLLGGNLKIVKPNKECVAKLKDIQSLRIFDSYNSIQDAVMSFNAGKPQKQEEYGELPRQTISARLAPSF
jgi:anti-anti-sigma regulatory factor